MCYFFIFSIACSYYCIVIYSWIETQTCNEATKRYWRKISLRSRNGLNLIDQNTKSAFDIIQYKHVYIHIMIWFMQALLDPQNSTNSTMLNSGIQIPANTLVDNALSNVMEENASVVSSLSSNDLKSNQETFALFDSMDNQLYNL